MISLYHQTHKLDGFCLSTSSVLCSLLPPSLQYKYSIYCSTKSTENHLSTHPLTTPPSKLPWLFLSSDLSEYTVNLYVIRNREYLQAALLCIWKYLHALPLPSRSPFPLNGVSYIVIISGNCLKIRVKLEENEGRNCLERSWRFANVQTWSGLLWSFGIK